VQNLISCVAVTLRSIANEAKKASADNDHHFRCVLEKCENDVIEGNIQGDAPWALGLFEVDV
jgi:hypothetical protein